jgi:DNA polymerase III delta subunit
MIISLAGNNSFLISEKLHQLQADFLKNESDLALERIDASEVELGAILDAIASVPFLASRKMVILRGLSGNKQAADNIEQVISSTADSTDLVIVEGTLDKRSAYFKALKSLGNLQEFDEIDRAKLGRWLVEQATESSGKISHSDANYLVERVGYNQQNLYNELNKLITYQPEVTRQAIDLLTEKTPQSKVFDLLDAAFTAKKKEALELYADQRAQKVEPQAILSLITWQLQLIALTSFAGDKSSAEIAKEAKLSPYPVSKAQALAKKIGRSKLTKMIDEAFDIDWRSKNTGLDLDEALKAYIASL